MKKSLVGLASMMSLSLVTMKLSLPIDFSPVDDASSIAFLTDDPTARANKGGTELPTCRKPCHIVESK